MYQPLARRRASALVSRRLFLILFVAAAAGSLLILPARFALRLAAAQTSRSVNAAKPGPGVTPKDTGTGSVSLTTLDTAIPTETFNTLSNTAGSTTNTTLPTGWYITEGGGGARDNEQYAVDTGGSTTGDTYSYGSAASTDRALGELRSGTLIPVFGAKFTNNTGATITSLDVSYTGEQWRFGGVHSTVPDRLDFQYSTDATDLSTGTYLDANALDFNPPVTSGTAGALDGNAAANRTAISSTITGLSIPSGATFFIRFNDVDATGADDGLAIDDFSVTPHGGVATPTPTPTPMLNINDVAQAEGNAGTTSFTFTVSLTAAAPAGGVSFTVNTADGTATAPSDYTAIVNGTGSITQGNSSTTVTVQVNGDTTTETNETFFVNITGITGATAGDTQGLGTIQNDDVTLAPIHDIQGNGSTSPLVGQSVNTSGIVYAVKSNGFFIQTPDAQVDADPNTSEGVFVFTSSTPPASAVVGNSVQVSGTVQEFIPSTDPYQHPATELGGTISVVLLSTGNTLPTPTTITAADTLVNNLDNLEKYEGMRVTVPSLTTIAPTQGTITENSATVSSNGVFYGVVTGVPRPFREPGINISDPLPSPVPSPNNIPRFDENPERIRVDSDALTGTTRVDVPAGVVLTNVTGPLDYAFRTYTILPETTITLPATLPTPVPVPTPTSGEFTVASFNMERFFNNVADAGESGAPTLTTTAYNGRLNKASLIIRTVQRYPDVIGVEEMENLATLTDVANKVNSDAQTIDGLPNPNYQPYLVEGNDVGGIDVGFLVKASRINVVDVTQYGKTTTITNPDSSTSLLNDRPPLVLRATINRPAAIGGTVAFTVIVNHLRSLNGIDDTTAGSNGFATEGDRVRNKRRAQAEYLANLIQARQTADPNEKIISVGDYNAFRVNDGYVDVMGTIKGTPAPADQVTLASPDLVNPDLTDLVDTLPADQRYSYSFDGNAQTLDHALVNPNMQSILTRFVYARDDADYPVKDYENSNVPRRISDHDQPIAYFSIAPTTQAGQLIISEYRLSGPGGATDEFVELYNNTYSDIFVNTTDGSAGYALVGSDNASRFVVPNGTVIPARGHYLGCNSAGYSLSSYPSGDGSATRPQTTATCDITYTADIPDNGGIALFNTANGANWTIANRLDAVGSTSVADTLYREGAGLPTLSITNAEYSFYRDMAATGLPKDTNDNVADFLFVDTNGTSAGAGQRLGAPGPENLSSPVNRGAAIKSSLIDPGCTGSATVQTQACPRYRDLTPGSMSTSTNGTLSIRRRFTNSTGQPVTRLRFRLVDFTTLPQAQQSAGTADLRAITSSDQPAVCMGAGGGCASIGSAITITGTTLETPPNQPNGGGFNSTLSAGTVTLAAPLTAGSSINLQFLLGVQTPGSFRFFINVEALPNLTSVATPSTSPVNMDSPKSTGQTPANGGGPKSASGDKRTPVFKEN